MSAQCLVSREQNISDQAICISFALEIAAERSIAQPPSSTTMKSTDTDFASAITSTAVRPKPSFHINASFLDLHLPVAQPSPLFDGINEDINIHRFPAFQDPLTIEGVPALAPHCTLHCGHRVCMHLSMKGLDSLACQCGSEEREPKEEKTVMTWYRPEMDLDYLVMNSIEDSIANADPLHEIDVYYNEVLKILAHLQERARSLALHNEYLVRAVHCDYPGHEEEIAYAAVDHIFRIMRLYFHRILRSQDHHLISIQQLQRELNVYLWTLLAEWVEAHCDDETRNRVVLNEGPASIIQAISGSTAAILELWEECIEGVLELLLWRDEEVKWCNVESRVVFGVLTVILLWVLIIILWGNVGSHI